MYVTAIPTHVCIYYLLQLKKGGVAKAKGEGEKKKECTAEYKSRRRRDSLMNLKKPGAFGAATNAGSNMGGANVFIFGTSAAPGLCVYQGRSICVYCNDLWVQRLLVLHNCNG
jgi:hypothetical protein